MAKQWVLLLDAEAKKALLAMRDTDPKPYRRERAAALLKVAEGYSGREVARHLLLRPRCQDTLYQWLTRYKAQGLAGLTMLPGRGRKPLFSPPRPGRGQRPGGTLAPGAP